MLTRVGRLLFSDPVSDIWQSISYYFYSCIFITVVIVFPLFLFVFTFYFLYGTNHCDENWLITSIWKAKPNLKKTPLPARFRTKLPNFLQEWHSPSMNQFLDVFFFRVFVFEKEKLLEKILDFPKKGNVYGDF